MCCSLPTVKKKSSDIRRHILEEHFVFSLNTPRTRSGPIQFVFCSWRQFLKKHILRRANIHNLEQGFGILWLLFQTTHMHLKLLLKPCWSQKYHQNRQDFRCSSVLINVNTDVNFKDGTIWLRDQNICVLQCWLFMDDGCRFHVPMTLHWLLCVIIGKVPIQGLSGDFKNACPNQLFQNICPSSFSHLWTSNPNTNYI